MVDYWESKRHMEQTYGEYQLLKSGQNSNVQSPVLSPELSPKNKQDSEDVAVVKKQVNQLIIETQPLLNDAIQELDDKNEPTEDNQSVSDVHIDYL